MPARRRRKTMATTAKKETANNSTMTGNPKRTAAQMKLWNSVMANCKKKYPDRSQKALFMMCKGICEGIEKNR